MLRSAPVAVYTLDAADRGLEDIIPLIADAIKMLANTVTVMN